MVASSGRDIRWRVSTTAKGKLVLCSIQKDILDVFKITQLNKVLTLCTDLDDALSKF